MASAALTTLSKRNEGWRQGEQNKHVLVWKGDSEALNALKITLSEFGADTDKIDSIKYSVDYGERFECDVLCDDPDQTTFKF
jgi:hypothetical protein